MSPISFKFAPKLTYDRAVQSEKAFLPTAVTESGKPINSTVPFDMDNGKTFTVLAPGVSRENIYIQSVKVNGQPYDKSYITHRQIMDGATVEFEMGPEPGNIWYR